MTSVLDGSDKTEEKRNTCSKSIGTASCINKKKVVTFMQKVERFVGKDINKKKKKNAQKQWS